jgi:hypothetical protein
MGERILRIGGNRFFAARLWAGRIISSIPSVFCVVSRTMSIPAILNRLRR